MHSQTHVFTVAECQVLFRVAADVQAVGGVEDLGVAVGSREPQGDGVPRANLPAA